MRKPEVSVIVPLFNEEGVVPKLAERLLSLVSTLPFNVEFVLVDDGSKDATPRLIEELCLNNNQFTGVFLSRNYGHQLAVSAGMESASASQATMIIDGDLQDPPELLTTFYEKIREGYDVVYAIRKKRMKAIARLQANNRINKDVYL